MKHVFKESVIFLALSLTLLPLIIFMMLIGRELGILNLGYHGSKLFTNTPAIAMATAVALRFWWYKRPAKKD